MPLVEVAQSRATGMRPAVTSAIATWEQESAWIERPGRGAMESLRSEVRLTGPQGTARSDSAGNLTLGFVGGGRAARSLGRSLGRSGHRLLVAARGDSAARLA